MGFAQWIEGNKKERENIRGELNHCTERIVASCEKEADSQTVTVTTLQ
jgi:hypothetical protein